MFKRIVGFISRKWSEDEKYSIPKKLRFIPPFFFDVITFMIIISLIISLKKIL